MSERKRNPPLAGFVFLVVLFFATIGICVTVHWAFAMVSP
jgi:hypothetical protein